MVLYLAAVRDLGMLRGKITAKLTIPAQTTYPNDEVENSVGKLILSKPSIVEGSKCFSITIYATT
jgi:hypothetical protein